MRRKRIAFAMICLLAIWLVFATKGRVGNTTNPPSNVMANGPGPATFRYWGEVGGLIRSRSPAERQLAEQRAALQAGKFVTIEQVRSFWERSAALYDEMALHSQTVIEQIEQLPTQEVDQSAAEIATAAVSYLTIRAELLRINGRDCRTYSILFADIATAGGTIDEATPVGRRFAEREQEIITTMADRMGHEGRDDKSKLGDFLAAGRVRAELSTRYTLDFPDINAPTSRPSK